VAAGALDALAELAANPPAGARVRPLAVAGAFHTEYMAPAQKALGTYAEGLSAKDPGQLLLSNYDGTAVSSGPDALARLVGQVTRPVRWDLCQATLRDVGVTAILELPPAGTLVGLAKRQLPGVELLAIKSPDDLDRARAMLTSYTVSGAEGGEHTPDFQVVITPIKGVFTRASELVEGTGVARGTRLGTVRTNRDEHPIVAPNAGVLTEWLRHDGDIVAAGLPVARIGSGSDL
jgi:[acyl-carrier-protein] S-malonyltransferase